MNRRFSILFSIFIFLFLVNSALAENNEKTMIQKSSFFGNNIAKPRKIKKSGIIQLQPWEPYVKYAETVPNDLLKKLCLGMQLHLTLIMMKYG